MRRKTSQSSFGCGCGLIGGPEKTDVRAVVGAINDDSDLRIGLTAVQLDNIGHDYGQVSVQLYNENPTPVEVYNAFGANAQDGPKIWISRGLADKMELRPGEVLKVHRVLDEQGRIRYKCESQENNPLGQDWGKIKQPAIGIVAAIDDDGYNVELYRVGLSAMQMDNLGIKRRRRSAPLNYQTLRKTIRANERGLLDGQDYRKLVVEFGVEKKFVQVYNAFGMRGIGGCGVRVSSTLAEDFGLKLENEVKLYTQIQLREFFKGHFPFLFSTSPN